MRCTPQPLLAFPSPRPLLLVHRAARPATRLRSSEKLVVPPDAFGGATPERAAAAQLARLLTHAAAHAVLDQLPAGGDARAVLADHLSSTPVGDADAWLAGLARRSAPLASRVADTRLAYATDEVVGFEWDNARCLAVDALRGGNASVLREWLRTQLET